MEILVNGKKVKEYFKNYKTYIEGKKDSVFSIRIKNNSSERTLFVPTVDGLSVIDGENGSFDSRGYILEPFSSMTIDGWRINDNEVAEFYFSSKDDSYRKRMKKGDNLGSIAVAIFREKAYIDRFNFTFDDKIMPDWPVYQNDPKLNNNVIYTNNKYDPITSLRTCACSSMSQEIGTGFGNTKRSVVESVHFRREQKPVEILEVFYNTRKQLSKMGINFNERKYLISDQNSFPNESGYCKRPNN